MISVLPIILLLLSFFFLLLQYFGHPFLTLLSRAGLGILVVSTLLYSISYELLNQWPHLSLRLPGYFLLWAS